MGVQIQNIHSGEDGIEVIQEESEISGPISESIPVFCEIICGVYSLSSLENNRPVKFYLLKSIISSVIEWQKERDTQRDIAYETFLVSVCLTYMEYYLLQLLLMLVLQQWTANHVFKSLIEHLVTPNSHTEGTADYQSHLDYFYIEESSLDTKP